ncbi:MAG: DUF4097 family beta strand repeat protein [Oscillospiraceae bacterium]|nr:DUF4097 family beta strand repeat protein [Oscillospiraceae bacterium]
MKNYKRTAIITGVILLAAGFVITAVASVFTAGTNYSAPFLGGELVLGQSYEPNVYTIDEPFENIYIDETSANVHIFPSDDDICHVKYKNSKSENRSISVENGTLKITVEKNMGWFERHGLFFIKSNNTTEIYLPEKEYQNLFIETESSDICLSSEIKFESAELSSTGGKIYLMPAEINFLSIETTSGDIEINSSLIKSCSVTTTSGNFYSQDSNFSSLNCSTISGEISFYNSAADTKATLSTTSGDIIFDNFDPKSVFINSVSGNVSGSFSSPMDVFASTNSGEVMVAASDKYGKICEIITVSGDIDIY